METYKDVAIILVNYNGYKDTIECINSILKSDMKSTIVVVDNASHQNESKMIQERIPDVVSIRSNVNEGFSAGNNIGINYALENGYKNILLLNNDTVIAEDMIRLLRENVTINNICVPKMFYYYEPYKIWYGGGCINKKTGNAEHYNWNVINDNSIDTIENCTFASGCCMMVSSATFELVGLLAEDYFMYCEDTDFCIRLAEAGIKIKYMPEAVLWHKVGGSTKGYDSPFSTYYMTRNRLNYVKKYNDYFTKKAYIFSLISRYLRAFGCYAKKDIRYKYFLRAIKDHRKGITGKVDL